MKESARVVVDRKRASWIVQDSKCDNPHISEFDYDLVKSRRWFSVEVGLLGGVLSPYSDAGLQVCKIVLYPLKR